MCIVCTGIAGAGGEVVSVTEGAGPVFAARQRLAVAAAVGQHATLDCRVLRLADKAVSTHYATTHTENGAEKNSVI